MGEYLGAGHTEQSAGLRDQQALRRVIEPKFRVRAKEVLDRHVSVPEIGNLGSLRLKNGSEIRSTMGPFQVATEHLTVYPDVVVQALGNLYAEYNQAFHPIVAANREWDTDYQYAIRDDGTPNNGWVQIDMVGLPQRFLDEAASMREQDVREALRSGIFEIENSLAMYQLLERIFASGSEDTLFRREFRSSLDDLRQKTGKKIALLAVTDQKYTAMRETEFGKVDGELLTDAEVFELSGFDRFFGPDEFAAYVDSNGGNCDYLLYARTSNPVAKLRKPDIQVQVPLLSDDRMRRIIKAHAITFNVDHPDWSSRDPRKMNDTKAYLSTMGMAYVAHAETDIFRPEVIDHLGRGKALSEYKGDGILSERFADYLRDQGLVETDVLSGVKSIRAKPEKDTYGCYGHVSGSVGDRKVRQDLRKGLKERGSYVIQPEMTTPIFIDSSSGQRYTYIDRVFMSTDGQHVRYMGAFRSLMPLDSVEAQQGRVHGNESTVWAPVY